MYNFLPLNLKKTINRLGEKTITEIRIRAGEKVVIRTTCEVLQTNITLSFNDINEIVLSACNRSIYSYDEHIKKGFITTKDGVRIGLAGEFVINNGNVIAIKNFTSLVIRVPNQIIGVADNFFNNIYKGGSVLVISKTGAGKTTFIRDFSRTLSNSGYNVCVVDERNEIAPINNSFSFDLGKNVDVLTYSTKLFGFNQAIRALNPSVIVTDELTLSADVKALINSVYGGTSVVATVHGDSVEGVFNREFLRPLKKMKIFDYYVLITLNDQKRNISYYDKEFKLICL